MECGPEATEYLEELQAEKRAMCGWTLQTSLECTWRTATFAQLYPAIRDDIYEMAFWCGTTPTGQQCMLLDAIQRGDQRVAVKSGQGPGKTTITTIVGAWWAIRWINSTTLLTAPSMNLAQKVWIAEFKRTMGRAHPLLREFFEVSKSKIRLGKDEEKYRDWVILPRTASTAEGIAGQHENHMNIIIEEASGVEDAVMETLFGTGSNEKSDWNPDAEPCSYLLIGNPTRVEGMFYRIFTDPAESEGWTLLTFDAERTPMVSRDKVAREERLYGRNSSYFRVRVSGEFPDTADSLLIRYEDLEACSNLPVRKTARNLHSELQWGHDLARQGGDETVSYLRKGGAVILEKVWTGNNTFEPATAIRWAFTQDAVFEHTDPDDILHVFDSIGVGQGVVHLFSEANKNFYMFNAGSSALRSQKYENQISEAWFQLAVLIRKRLITVPKDQILWQQLTTRRYEAVKNGKWRIEPKTDYVKRVNRGSPDRADALAMCFYQIGVRGRLSQK